jgi:hypothetical protein
MRLMGRNFYDVQSDIKYLPFKVIDKSGKPYIRVTDCGEEKDFVRHVSWFWLVALGSIISCL